LFLGHTGNMSKTYQGKSREELEFYYEMVESKITIQMDEENDEIDRLHEELKKVKEKETVIQELKKAQEETDIRVDMMREQVTSYLNKELDENKEPNQEHLMLFAKLVRLKMHMSPEYAEDFKKFVNEDPTVPAELKKKFSEI